MPTLPSEYQRVEYIQSSGTQYIDTAFPIKSTYEITITLTPLEASVDKAFFGVYDGSGQACELGQIGVNFRGNVGETNAPRVVVGQKFTFNYTSGRWNYDETPFGINRNTDTTNGALIFGRYYNGITKLNSLKLYELKIYDNGSLVRNYVPCYRKSDNEIGVYDLVNGVFYTNQGTGTFVKGKNIYPDRIVKMYAGTQEVKKLYFGTSQIAELYKGTPMLPPEYIQAKWVSINDTGTNLFRIDVSSLHKTLVSTDVEIITTMDKGLDSSQMPNSYYILEQLETENNQFFFSVGIKTIYIGGINGKNTISYSIWRVNSSTTFKTNEDGVYKNGSEVATIGVVQHSEDEIKNIGVAMYKYRTYKGTIVKSNGVEVFRVIPAYRISDGMFGLYEVYSKTFTEKSIVNTRLIGEI